MSRLDTAHQRLEQAVDRLDAAIRANRRLTGDDPSALADELAAVRAENATLVRNGEQISSRLDSAIDKIRTVLET